MKEIKFKIPIYNSVVRYIVSEDIITYLKTTESYYDANDNDAYGIATFVNGAHTIVIMDKCKDNWSIIAHEVIHVANRILESRGVEISTSNDEALTYLVSYIIEQIQKKKDVLNK